ncbi:MAG TPA: aminotransferase class V-fold PLP-dependent enzyme [Solirubrobacteraceae bacterium]|nr:aminotransferase class V-fold PLP-dependent enzyme [Solirubrobacteraceae bacterium]
MDIEAVAAEFPSATGYLDTATMGLPPARATAALHAAIDAWQAGAASAPGYDAAVERSRELFAGLVGVPPAWVAVGGQVASFTGLVAASLPAGAEVVCVEGEFTSVLFPFLARDDLRVRIVAPDALAAAIGPATALAAVSAVQSSDGSVTDLDGVRDAVAAHRARLLVDATQAVGWLPVDARAADYLVCGAYKWLLAPRGSAFLSVRPEHWETLRPIHASWYGAPEPYEAIYGGPLRLAADARRFNVSPAWLSWVGTAEALELIAQVGVEAIHAHDVALADRVRTGLGQPPGDSAIVSLAVDDAQAERLRASGVRFSIRDGRARLAFHLYSHGADVETVLAVLGR